MITVGSEMPAFALTNADDEHVDSATLRGRSLFLYFYPRAGTPGCTQQACLLRDVAGAIGDTRVVGISPDKPAALARFAAAHDLGFTLLSDPDHIVAEAFDVWQEKRLYAKTSMGIVRSAFLVDPAGIVRHTWYKISPKDTPVKLLEALR